MRGRPAGAQPAVKPGLGRTGSVGAGRGRSVPVGAGRGWSGSRNVRKSEAVGYAGISGVPNL